MLCFLKLKFFLNVLQKKPKEREKSSHGFEFYNVQSFY